MKKTILVVDDEDVILTALKAQLTGFGYKVLTAPGGAQALDILSSEEIDLIIADINMPEIGGKKILTAVKEIEPETPIMIITGIDVEKGRAFADEHAADGFLAKPWEDNELRALVEAILKKGKRA